VTVVPAKYEERLAWRVRTHESKALEAAVTLFERIEPNTIDEAVQQICPDRRPPSDVFDVIADAWSLYRHIADMPCD
jgi:hypothetical protein